MKKIALVAALTISLTGFAQNKLGFNKGQKLEVVTEVKKTSSMELMGQAMETTTNSNVITIYDVKDVTPQGSVIEHKIKKLSFSADAMGKTQTFDSEKQEDLDGELGKLLEKSIKNKFTMNLDPLGKVTSVKLDDDNPADTEEGAIMADIISSQLGFNLVTPKAGAATEFYILPGRAVKKGDKWSDSSSANGETKKISYTVENVTDSEIMLIFTEDVNLESTKNIMGTEATFKATTKNTGMVTLDKKTGLLKQKTTTSDSEGTIEAQGQAIPSRDKTTTTVTVKPA